MGRGVQGRSVEGPGARSGSVRGTECSSLRFRLPAFFLAGVALAGIVSTAIAVQLFQDHLRSQSLSELRREAKGLTQLYQAAALRSIDEGRSAPDFAGPELEKATGAHLYYVGAPVFFRHGSGLASSTASRSATSGRRSSTARR